MYVYMERVKNSSDVSFALRQVDKPVSNYGAFNELEKSKECGVYINPFRVVDLSVIPSHILQELESYPILTQIAILSNPEIRKKYFPYWKQQRTRIILLYYSREIRYRCLFPELMNSYYEM